MSEKEAGINFSSSREIIDFAIKREEEAVLGYSRMMEKTQLPGLKEMLSELREEERKHKKLLEEATDKEILLHHPENITDLKISDYLVEEELNPESSFQDLMIFAAKKEQKAVALYESLSEMVENPEFEKLFRFLADQEKAHKLKLETEYDKHIYQWD